VKSNETASFTLLIYLKTFPQALPLQPAGCTAVSSTTVVLSTLETKFLRFRVTPSGVINCRRFTPEGVTLNSFSTSTNLGSIGLSSKRYALEAPGSAGIQQAERAHAAGATSASERLEGLRIEIACRFRSSDVFLLDESSLLLLF
jgi:hypothetical protein